MSSVMDVPASCFPQAACPIADGQLALLTHVTRLKNVLSQLLKGDINRDDVRGAVSRLLQEQELRFAGNWRQGGSHDSRGSAEMWARVLFSFSAQLVAFPNKGGGNWQM